MKITVGFILVLLFLSAASFGQISSEKTFVFDGYVMTPDSMPLDGAYIINYRNSKIVATDHSGYFKMVVEKGDSVMINHLSMAPKVVKVRQTYIDKVRIIVDFRTYMVNPITTYDEEKKRSNLEKNMQQLNQDMKEQIIVDPTKRTGNDNTYNEATYNPGATIMRVAPTISKKDKMENREIKAQ